MLTVTGLAKRGGTTADAVRYYTRKGLLQPDRDPNNGYQLYRPRDVRWLRFIRQAKQLGYTLGEIKEIMHDAGEGQSPCPRVREILQRHIVDNRKRLDELLQLQTRMEQALLDWADQPDGTPDGQSVCHLIESINTDEAEANSETSSIQQTPDNQGVLRDR